MGKAGTGLIVVFGIALFIWAGLQVPPSPFENRSFEGARRQTIEIPRGLPQPVERFFTVFFPDGVEDIRTVIFNGRGRIRPFGIWLPARFVFIHEAGKNYRHYFETTWFGIPFLKVEEGYVDGESFFESPMGTTKNDPNTNQGANLALWAEAGWFPSVWITDSRVAWEPVDSSTALLRVPYGSGTEIFVVRFDPATGLMDTMEVMRYREPGADKRKILWIAQSSPVKGASNKAAIASGSAMWLDQGKPWATFTMESAIYNADVSAYIRERGH